MKDKKKYRNVFAVIDPPNDASGPSRWLKVGIAFDNVDGSINIFLDAFPTTTNKLQIRDVD